MSKGRLRVGVIGCGGIAQMMHLPFLEKNADRFEIAALCDLSDNVLSALAKRYHLPDTGCFTDYRMMLKQNLDAVLVTSGGDHTPQVRAALLSGAHVFVEKPLCYTQAQALELGRLAQEQKLKLMVGYMKRYDPAYQRARQLLAGLGELRYVQLNTLHPEEEGYLYFQGLIQADDVAPETIRHLRAQEDQAITAAVGEIPAYLRAEYTDVLLGSMVHDINVLRGLLGEPQKVLFAEHWPQGEKPGGITTTMMFSPDLRVVYTWVFLAELRDYSQEIALMSASQRLRLQFPSPYLKHFPTLLTHQYMKDGAAVEEKITVNYDEAFEQELLAFYDCVVNDREPLTGADDARADIAVLQQILAGLHPVGLSGEAAGYMLGRN